MTEKTEEVTIHFKYENTEQTFYGSPDDAWFFMNNFFKGILPTFKIARKLWLNVDLEKLAIKSEGSIAFSNEGANILVPQNRLTDNETILLWLLAAYLGNKLGILPTETIEKETLQTKLCKSKKITSTRLGELSKGGYITKTNNGSYKITTSGLAQMEKETLQIIKSKIATQP